MKQFKVLPGVLCLIAVLALGCNSNQNPIDTIPDDPATEIHDLMNLAYPVASPPAPGLIVTAAFGDAETQFWPYTGNDFTGNPQDPINLIFIGKADPRDIRAALLALDGDRSAFGLPPMPPFNSRWEDALGGDVQSVYGVGPGWVGSCIQLACGDYLPLRIHMRLFRVGQWTIANAHFEANIPGTTNHQVLNWEIAEQFVAVDMMRTGLLDPEIPMMPTGQINDSPFRVIPAIIYNELPVELRGLIGGPLENVTEDVPITTDGHALIFNIAGAVPRVAETRFLSITIQWGQTVPKPFCSSGPEDYVYVSGPVQLTQTSTITECGDYETAFKAEGLLSVISINPYTGEPIGKPLQAVVRETQKALFNDKTQRIWGVTYQQLGPYTRPGSGRYFKMFEIGLKGPYIFNEDVKCYGVDN